MVAVIVEDYLDDQSYVDKSGELHSKVVARNPTASTTADLQAHAYLQQRGKEELSTLVLDAAGLSSGLCFEDVGGVFGGGGGGAAAGSCSGSGPSGSRGAQRTGIILPKGKAATKAKSSKPGVPKLKDLHLEVAKGKMQTMALHLSLVNDASSTLKEAAKVLADEEAKTKVGAGTASLALADKTVQQSVNGILRIVVLRFKIAALMFAQKGSSEAVAAGVTDQMSEPDRLEQALQLITEDEYLKTVPDLGPDAGFVATLQQINQDRETNWDNVASEAAAKDFIETHTANLRSAKLIIAALKSGLRDWAASTRALKRAQDAALQKQKKLEETEAKRAARMSSKKPAAQDGAKPAKRQRFSGAGEVEDTDPTVFHHIGKFSPSWRLPVHDTFQAAAEDFCRGSAFIVRLKSRNPFKSLSKQTASLVTTALDTFEQEFLSAVSEKGSGASVRCCKDILRNKDSPEEDDAKNEILTMLMLQARAPGGRRRSSYV